MLEGLDHDIRFVIAPDKASIYPEFMSDAMIESCDRTQGTIMESSVRRLVPSAIDSWGILKAAKADDPYLVYEARRYALDKSRLNANRQSTCHSHRSVLMGSSEHHLRATRLANPCRFD